MGKSSDRSDFQRGRSSALDQDVTANRGGFVCNGVIETNIQQKRILWTEAACHQQGSEEVRTRSDQQVLHSQEQRDTAPETTLSKCTNSPVLTRMGVNSR
ncbi:hypothetical protein GDO78_021987 [Eleutherodactylus coqui]|uniref:Uncharacterized protein n=1 Tax=Eleutherodactylus coqui TaxID=57060 RepID=A0A8J6BH78_ELECQ|nr:hypothetical protein GDO78_021987 [Eleutherodactylus coqui]